MRTGRFNARDERGIALVFTLILLFALTATVLALLAVSGVEPQISENLNETSRARFVAEAGIEFGFNTLASSTNWSGLLGTNAGVLATNSAIPGKPVAEGTFTVSIRNDAQAGDVTMTGVSTDTGGATTDTNGVLILSAVGRFGRATQTLTAVVKRPPLPDFPAAVSFPGQEADVYAAGTAFSINGVDQNLDGTPGSNPPKLGIAVSSVLPNPGTPSSPGPPGANEAGVQNDLTALQKSKVTGANQFNAAQTTSGDNTIAAEPTLTPQAIATFINQAKQSADIVVDSTQADPASFNNIGNTCSTNVNDANCWGTPANPKIVYVKGAPDPTSLFTALTVAGNSSGTGILIVEDGDFIMKGNFRWEGPVIVTGKYVGVGYMGGGNQEIIGALVVNETAANEAVGFNELLIKGNGKIQYSKQALDLAQGLRKLTSVSSWRE